MKVTSAGGGFVCTHVGLHVVTHQWVWMSLTRTGASRLMPGWCPTSNCFYLTLPDEAVITFRHHRGLYHHRIGSGPDTEFAESHSLAAEALLISEGHAFAGIPVMSKEGL